jgi:hypothetical protein
MFSFQDLFQWERFITPSIIKIFYWLVVGMSVLYGMAGAVQALSMMVTNFFVGFLMMFASVIGMVVGIIFARIISEFILIVFRMNEHLGALRNRGEV